MSPTQAIVTAFYQALESATGEGNIHKVFAAARAAGFRFDNRAARRWLDPFIHKAKERGGNQPRSTVRSDRAAPILSTEQRASSTIAAPSRARKGINSKHTSSVLHTSEAPTLFGNEGTKVSKLPDTSWREPLTLEASRLLGRPMREWSADERFTWARWHAMAFGNCRVSESRNKVAATKIAAGLATMAFSRDYGDVTGREYQALAERVHRRRDEKPWFDPWLIKGAEEAAL